VEVYKSGSEARSLGIHPLVPIWRSPLADVIDHAIFDQYPASVHDPICQDQSRIVNRWHKAL
jgi:hypothetical protein